MAVDGLHLAPPKMSSVSDVNAGVGLLQKFTKTEEYNSVQYSVIYIVKWLLMTGSQAQLLDRPYAKHREFVSLLSLSLYFIVSVECIYSIAADFFREREKRREKESKLNFVIGIYFFSLHFVSLILLIVLQFNQVERNLVGLYRSSNEYQIHLNLVHPLLFAKTK